jgi:predicted metal-dependent hydrolase
MTLVTLVFWSRIVVQQLVLMRVERCLFSPREWGSLLKFLFLEPGGMRGLGRRWLAYYRPSFHPWDLDNRPLLETWIRELGARP